MSTSSLSNTSIASSGRRSSRATTLTPSETDLWELCHYAGLTIDPQVFHNIMDLLHMDIHPQAVLEMLTKISQNSKYKEVAGDSNASDAKKKDSKTSTQSRKTVRSADNKETVHKSSRPAPNVSTRRKDPSADSTKNSTMKSRLQSKSDNVKPALKSNK